MKDPKEIRIVTAISFKELRKLVDLAVRYADRRSIITHHVWMDSSFPKLMRALERRHHLLRGADLPGPSQHMFFWLYARNLFRERQYRFLKDNCPRKFKKWYGGPGVRTARTDVVYRAVGKRLK